MGSGHGAEDITGHNTDFHVTVIKCLDLCDDTPECECVAYERSTSGCWLRKHCYPDYFRSSHHFDSYYKLPQRKKGTNVTSSKVMEDVTGDNNKIYRQYGDTNAFSGHGAEDITGHNTDFHVTVIKCLDLCDDTPECGCVAYERSTS